MSYKIETQSHGKVVDFGYFSGDTFRVRLGELPPASLDEFIRRSLDFIPAAYANLDTHTQDQIFAYWQKMYQQLHIGRIIDSESLDTFVPERSMGEIVEILHTSQNRNEVNTVKRQIFQQFGHVISGDPDNELALKNFYLKDGKVHIGNYIIGVDEFLAFFTYLCDGGIFGWSDNEVPDYVVAAVEQLLSKFREIK